MDFDDRSRVRGARDPGRAACGHRRADPARQPDGVACGALAAARALCGICITTTASWLLRAAPRATAVLVEPDPVHLVMRRRDFALNGAEGLIRGAVGVPHGSVAPFACE